MTSRTGHLGFFPLSNDKTNMAATPVQNAAVNTVSDIFKKMSYGPAPEADNVVKVLCIWCF